MTTIDDLSQRQESSSQPKRMKTLNRQRSYSFDGTLTPSESTSTLSERKPSILSIDSLEDTTATNKHDYSVQSSSTEISQIRSEETSMINARNDGLRSVKTVTEVIRSEIKSMPRYSSQDTLSSLTPSPQIGSLIEYFTRLSTRNSTLLKSNELLPKKQLTRIKITPDSSLLTNDAVEMPRGQVTHPSINLTSKFIIANDETSESIPSTNKDDDSPTETEGVTTPRQSTRSNSSETTVHSTDEIDENNEQLNKKQIIIQETLDTEQTYTKVLFVLSSRLPRAVDQVCQNDRTSRDKFYQLFSMLLKALKDLYQLHHRQIVPQLTACLTGHRQGAAWAVLEENFNAIESCYKAYYVAFDEIQLKIEPFRLQNPLINEAMSKMQQELDNLDPMTQLNCPNQRLVRYPLLMVRYMKCLEENSSEYEHTNAIKDEIERIARRCGEQLMVSPSKCEDLRRRLDNKIDYFKTQTLLWHGSVKKQSPRKHADIVRRYLILLSDRMLVCQESGSKLELNRELSLKELTVTIDEDRRSPISNNSNNTMLYPFRVHAVEKSYEFSTETVSDREVWVRMIQGAVKALAKNPRLIYRTEYDLYDELQLGTRAPRWVNDIDVTRCQHCHNRFRTNITTSRHHCRACGRCICGPCSTKKLILSYCKQEGDVKVCDRCYEQLTHKEVNKSNRQIIPVTKNPNQMILFGDFHLGLSRNKVWIALDEDLHLHVYGARLDAVEEYSMDLTKIKKINVEEKTRLFTLQGRKGSHQFSIPHNHRIDSSNNEVLNQKLRANADVLKTIVDLWFSSMSLAMERKLPDWWHEGKRVSLDSGFSERLAPSE